MPSSQQLADRLRAHARLYRHIAEQTWSETRAEELVRLADECTHAADTIAEKSRPDAAWKTVPRITNPPAAGRA